MKKQKSNIYLIGFYLYLFSLIPIFLSRLLLLIMYRFPDLTTWEILRSFLMGVRVDIITLNTFIGIFLFLLLLPIEKLQTKPFRITIGTLWFLVLTVIILFCFGDVFYFGYVHRHVTKEIIALQKDLPYIFKDEMFGRFLPYTLITFVGLAVYYFAFYIFLKKEVSIPPTALKKWGYTFLVLLFIAQIFFYKTQPH